MQYVARLYDEPDEGRLYLLGEAVGELLERPWWRLDEDDSNVPGALRAAVHHPQVSHVGLSARVHVFDGSGPAASVLRQGLRAISSLEATCMARGRSLFSMSPPCFILPPGNEAALKVFAESAAKWQASGPPLQPAGVLPPRHWTRGGWVLKPAVRAVKRSRTSLPEEVSSAVEAGWVSVLQSVPRLLGRAEAIHASSGGGDSSSQIDSKGPLVMVAQKQIERPLLLGGRKVSLHAWLVLIETRSEGVPTAAEALWYTDTYVRLASRKMDMSFTKPQGGTHDGIHVTTTSLQVSRGGFGKQSAGNVMDTREFSSAVQFERVQRAQKLGEDVTKDPDLTKDLLATVTLPCVKAILKALAVAAIDVGQSSHRGGVPRPSLVREQVHVDVFDVSFVLSSDGTPWMIQFGEANLGLQDSADWETRLKESPSTGRPVSVSAFGVSDVAAELRAQMLADLWEVTADRYMPPRRGMDGTDELLSEDEVLTVDPVDPLLREQGVDPDIGPAIPFDPSPENCFEQLVKMDFRSSEDVTPDDRLSVSTAVIESLQTGASDDDRWALSTAKRISTVWSTSPSKLGSFSSIAPSIPRVDSDSEASDDDEGPDFGRWRDTWQHTLVAVEERRSPSWAPLSASMSDAVVSPEPSPPQRRSPSRWKDRAVSPARSSKRVSFAPDMGEVVNQSEIRAPEGSVTPSPRQSLATPSVALSAEFDVSQWRPPTGARIAARVLQSWWRGHRRRRVLVRRRRQTAVMEAIVGAIQARPAGASNLTREFGPALPDLPGATPTTGEFAPAPVVSTSIGVSEPAAVVSTSIGVSEPAAVSSTSIGVSEPAAVSTSASLPAATKRLPLYIEAEFMAPAVPNDLKVDSPHRSLQAGPSNGYGIPPSPMNSPVRESLLPSTTVDLHDQDTPLDMRLSPVLSEPAPASDAAHRQETPSMPDYPPRRDEHACTKMPASKEARTPVSPPSRPVVQFQQTTPLYPPLPPVRKPLSPEPPVYRSPAGFIHSPKTPMEAPPSTFKKRASFSPPQALVGTDPFMDPSAPKGGDDIDRALMRLFLPRAKPATSPPTSSTTHSFGEQRTPSDFWTDLEGRLFPSSSTASLARELGVIATRPPRSPKDHHPPIPASPPPIPVAPPSRPPRSPKDHHPPIPVAPPSRPPTARASVSAGATSFSSVRHPLTAAGRTSPPLPASAAVSSSPALSQSSASAITSTAAWARAIDVDLRASSTMAQANANLRDFVKMTSQLWKD
jgi:hypothetical protein